MGEAGRWRDEAQRHVPSKSMDCFCFDLAETRLPRLCIDMLDAGLPSWPTCGRAARLIFARHLPLQSTVWIIEDPSRISSSSAFVGGGGGRGC